VKQYAQLQSQRIERRWREVNFSEIDKQRIDVAFEKDIQSMQVAMLSAHSYPNSTLSNFDDLKAKFPCVVAHLCIRYQRSADSG